MADAALDPALAERAFVAEVVRGMAALRAAADGPRPHTEDDLTIPLGLSSWIVRAAMDLPDAYDALLGLRRALVEAAGLHRASEPIPMRLPDPRAALRNLGAYLYELLGRAARHAGLSEIELSERTLTLIAQG
ncbi:MAG TPA: hypothetical protein VK386_01385 [Acidimicrobiales bacterium]|nr:hypothetical protein [Acidimicrobiales bacterium]